jgi:hypothetical protein
VHVTGLNLNDFYASVGSEHAFGQVDPKTGQFTPLLSAANEPGALFPPSPHGVAFIPDTGPASTHVANLVGVSHIAIIHDTIHI